MTLKQKVKTIKPANLKEKNLPKMIKWKGVSMVRNHSFMATVKEIVRFSEEIDVCRVGLVGDMHSGKSTLSQSIAHAIHKVATIPYVIKILYKEDLLNFQETLKGLEGVNYILIFDDVSFLGAQANKKQIEMVKQAVTTIRHIEGGKDVKIIVMMNYHYSFGLDKYLRTADFKYITTVSSSETENMEKMFGTKNKKKITEFKKFRQQAVTSEDNKGKGYWVMGVGKNQKIKYLYRDPFIPVLFWNEQSLRFIVSPTRQFIDPLCSQCSEGEGTKESEINVDQFYSEMQQKFGVGQAKAAVKLALALDGKITYPPGVVQGVRYINKCRMKKLITLEQLAMALNLDITKTKLRKKMDGVMAD